MDSIKKAKLQFVITTVFGVIALMALACALYFDFPFEVSISLIVFFGIGLLLFHFALPAMGKWYKSTWKRPKGTLIPGFLIISFFMRRRDASSIYIFPAVSVAIVISLWFSFIAYKHNFPTNNEMN